MPWEEAKVFKFWLLQALLEMGVLVSGKPRLSRWEPRFHPNWQNAVKMEPLGGEFASVDYSSHRDESPSPNPAAGG